MTVPLGQTRTSTEGRAKDAAETLLAMLAQKGGEHILDLTYSQSPKPH